ncbi:MAG: hypothetical protein IMW97_03065 [Firmicutes bacterium]|nr:hypothetical protein [Candidatus Fermentithermobacillaceae bacterium]
MGQYLEGKDIKTFIAVFLVAFVASVPLNFLLIFTHEGGHGLLILPAIILNRGLPETPSQEEGSTRAAELKGNPFTKFPPAVILFFLCFPLGVASDAFLSYLSLKAMKKLNVATLTGTVTRAILLSLSILALSSALENLLAGADFSFIWEAVGFPYEAPWLRTMLTVVSFVGFPGLLVIKGTVPLPEAAGAATGAFAGTWIFLTFMMEHVYPILMANFWWLFVVGTPVFILVAAALLKMAKANARQGEITA